VLRPSNVPPTPTATLTATPTATLAAWRPPHRDTIHPATRVAVPAGLTNNPVLAIWSRPPSRPTARPASSGRAGDRSADRLFLRLSDRQSPDRYERDLKIDPEERASPSPRRRGSRRSATSTPDVPAADRGRDRHAGEHQLRGCRDCLPGCPVGLPRLHGQQQPRPGIVFIGHSQARSC